MANYLDTDGLTYVWSKIKNMFAPKASPEFTGTPTAPTPATSDDSTKIATTAYVKNVVEGIDGATYSLTQSQSDGHILRFTGSDGTDTEIVIPDDDTTYSRATASADGLMSSTDFSKLSGIEAQANKTVVDSSLSASSTNPVENNVINTALGGKVDKITGKGLSENDYTTAEKNKLAGFSDASNYALKTDITGIYKYKGSVTDYASLPSSGQTSGDVYDTQDTGMNYAWNGTEWDALGMSFSITSISNATIDTICV